MKLFIIAAALMLSCNGNKAKPADPITALSGTMIDSCQHWMHEDSLLIESLNDQLTDLSLQVSRCQNTHGNCDQIVDSLKTKLFVSDYKVERVRHYLNITLRNPSQTKFLKGWIKRAIE